MNTTLIRTATTARNNSGDATTSRTALDHLPLAGSQLDEGALRLVAGGDDETTKACGTQSNSKGTCHWDADMDITL